MSFSPRTRESRTGPNSVTVVRMGVPLMAPAPDCGPPPKVNSSMGKERPSHACPVEARRAASFSLVAPGSASPVRSP